MSALRNRRKKVSKIWDRIFPLKVGDKIRVGKVYSTFSNIPSFEGKVGVVVKIGKDIFEDTPRDSNLPLRAIVYRVSFGGGKLISFRREELEKIEG